MNNNSEYYEIGLPPQDIVTSSSYGINNTRSFFLPIYIQPATIENAGDLLGEKISMNTGTGKSRLSEYVRNILGGSSISLKNGIKVYAMAEGPITESFNNDIQNNPIVDFLTNSSAFNFIQTIGRVMKAVRQNYSINKEAERKVQQKATEKASELLSGLGIEPTGVLGKISSVIQGTIMGNKFDFFRRWVGSSFNGNYSFSVRLFNPKPYNDEFHKKLILEPLAVFLALSLPVGQIVNKRDFGYFEPLYCKVKSPGLFTIDTGIVKSLTVIKGGNDNAIALNNRPFIVDIKIDFVSLLNIKVIDNPNKGQSDTNVSSVRKDNSVQEYMNVMNQKDTSNDDNPLETQNNPVGVPLGKRVIPDIMKPGNNRLIPDSLLRLPRNEFLNDKIKTV